MEARTLQCEQLPPAHTWPCRDAAQTQSITAGWLWADLKAKLPHLPPSAPFLPAFRELRCSLVAGQKGGRMQGMLLAAPVAPGDWFPFCSLGAELCSMGSGGPQGGCQDSQSFAAVIYRVSKFSHQHTQLPPANSFPNAPSAPYPNRGPPIHPLLKNKTPQTAFSMLPNLRLPRQLHHHPREPLPSNKKNPPSHPARGGEPLKQSGGIARGLGALRASGPGALSGAGDAQSIRIGALQ